MKIYETTTYKIDGKNFNNLKDVRTHVENRIGKLINNIQGFTRATVFDMIVANKKELTELLNITYETTSDCSDFGGVTYIDKNILDCDY